MNVQCSGVSRSFAKETRVLKVRSTVAGISSWQRPIESNHQSLSSYNNMRSCWRTQCQPLYSLHLKQIGKVKKLSKCCLMSWLKKKKKKAVLKCWLLLFCATMNHFSTGLWHLRKSGFYTTTSGDQFSGRTEKFQSTSQSQTSARKRSWSKSGDLLSEWSIIAFWILAKPYIWEICSANQWDIQKTATLAARTGQQNGLNSPWQRSTTHHTINTLVDWTGLRSFASSSIFTWPLVNRLLLLQASQTLFARKMLPQPAAYRKCFPKVQRILMHRFLHYMKTIYHWQKCVDCSVQSLSRVLTLCDPMNHSTSGLPVHHQLLEFTQTHVYRVSDAIQPSHPLSSPSPPAPNPSQHQSLFQWVNSSHEVAKVLEFQL